MQLNLKKIYSAVPYILLALLMALYIQQCSKTNTLKKQADHNIHALSDTIRQYKTKAGDVAAEKLLLTGDIKTLKAANDSLYQRVKELGVKKPQQVVYIKNDVVRESHDTVWANPSARQDFDFSDKWRELAGTVTYSDSALGLTIDKDIVHLDYTIAVKDGKVNISSANPYVKFNDIQGFSIPKQKQKHWHIGPAVGAGITSDLKLKPYAGVCITYSLLSW